MNVITAARLRTRARDWLASPAAQGTTTLTTGLLRTALRDADRAAKEHAEASLNLAARTSMTRWELARQVAVTHADLRLYLDRALTGYQYPAAAERRATALAAHRRNTPTEDSDDPDNSLPRCTRSKLDA